MNARTLPHQQPHISADLTLLCGGFLHEDLALDLYGQRDEDGVDVLDVALAGTTTSLHALASPETFEAWGKQLDRLLPSGAQLRKESVDQARIDSAIWDSVWAAN